MQTTILKLPTTRTRLAPTQDPKRLAHALAIVIRDHGHMAYVDSNGDIHAQCAAVRGADLFKVWEVVEPSFPAVRNWLGY